MKINFEAEEKLKILESMLERFSEIKEFDSEKFQSVFSEFAGIFKISKITASLDSDGSQILTLYNNNKQCGDDYVQSQPDIKGEAGRVVCRAEKNADWSEKDREYCKTVCLLISDALSRLTLGEYASNLYYYDRITGMPNINLLQETGNELVKNGRICEYTAIIANIKGTSYLNKKIGFENVTKIISAYMGIIRDLLDDNEIAARIGEDKFAVLVKKEKSREVIKILDIAPVEVQIGGKTQIFNIQSRAGVYDVDKNDISFYQVMSYAASALNYSRTIAHQDIVKCTYELESRIINMMGYTQQFKKSIENHDFIVVYQPKVLTTDNTIYGGEALVRWNYDGEILLPVNFIETLEREHLICRLDWYVLEETCRTLRSWIDRGVEPVKISVNFSNDHLHEDNLVNNVVKVVDSYKIPHKYIEIEMTETVDNEEIDTLFEYVDGLQSYGFSVAIDDFGIGYSSLHLLKNVPVDVLKIDKAFVSEITDESNKRVKVILENIINMSSQLGIEVVAEGVETKRQTEILRDMSCYRIQGFIFDKPLSEEDFFKRRSQRKYENVPESVSE